MLKCIFGGFWGCQLTRGASLLVEHVSYCSYFQCHGLCVYDHYWRRQLRWDRCVSKRHLHMRFGCARTDLE